MEFYYTADFDGTSFVANEISDNSGSFEATAADLPVIKKALKKSMPNAKPTLRLEYAARGFGYRTAAAMQNALSLATEGSPIVMTPLVGPLDEDRIGILTKASTPVTAEAMSAAVSASRAVIDSRGLLELPWDASGILHQRHVVHPLNNKREFSFIPEIAPPDLRTIIHETSQADIENSFDCFWGEIPKGWSIQFLTPESTKPKDLSGLRVGLVPPAKNPEKLPVYERPIIEKDHLCATTVLKNSHKEVVGFVTFSLSVRAMSEAEADEVNRSSYGEELNADDLAYFRPKTRCNNWHGLLNIEAIGDLHSGNAATWTQEEVEAWAKDDSLIKAAFLTLIEEVLGELAYKLSRTDVNNDDDDIGNFVLDFTSNGSHIGETDYDDFAVKLHYVLNSRADLWNDGREGVKDREISMMLCKSVYDYACEAFWERDIANPHGEDDERDDFDI